MRLDVTEVKVWEDYVLAQYPNEACAFVVEGKIHPVKNIAKNPTQYFKVCPIDRVNIKGTPEAFLHSHPYDVVRDVLTFPADWASEADMRSWIKDTIPWGISCTEGENVSDIVWYDDSIEAIEPFESRTFISGKNDCYSIIRDYYRTELSITLKNYPREMEWWEKGKNHYLDLFEDAGFKEIPLEDTREGDLLLIHLGTGITTHAMVVVGHNKVLHHVYNRYSGYSTISKWQKLITKAIRYDKDN